MESYSGQIMLSVFNLSIFRFDSVFLEFVAELALAGDSE